MPEFYIKMAPPNKIFFPDFFWGGGNVPLPPSPTPMHNLALKRNSVHTYSISGGQTRLRSSSLVIMTIAGQRYCQTIRQKSDTVSPIGPCTRTQAHRHTYRQTHTSHMSTHITAWNYLLIVYLPFLFTD